MKSISEVQTSKVYNLNWRYYKNNQQTTKLANKLANQGDKNWLSAQLIDACFIIPRTNVLFMCTQFHKYINLNIYIYIYI